MQEPKKDSHDASTLKIFFFDVWHNIDVTEDKYPGFVRALRKLASSSVHHNQLAEVFARVIGEAWERLEPEQRPQRRPVREDIVRYLEHSFPVVRIETFFERNCGWKAPPNVLYLEGFLIMSAMPCFTSPSSVEYHNLLAYRLLLHIHFTHELVRSTARYLLGTPDSSSNSSPTPFYRDAGLALEEQLYGAFLLYEAPEHHCFLQLTQEHAFLVEDPSQPGSAYLLPDQVLADWAHRVEEDFSNNRVLRKPPIDFATATPAPPPPPGYIRCRLANVFDPRPRRPAVPAGPPPEGYARVAIGGNCRRGPVQRLAQEGNAA
ncbi:hypothetical protein NBRC10512_001965 [Rhodotorula toruloides]|uniref:RHTO0S03e11342g1_1 n=2 Tax=Rhodotorula toruloides TaxID=5286 RepID=A0A061AM45_RHOTO|nr:uncharacterized protein RHTO_00536 [Rhodotorula toruloides NP11]EMS26108.1 hypothetical protein RHTO_00536 [Rhodotorula toruloides NP11]CDR38611.1 RHTO0S03e11342g1_1 [Rhodotorula toruloides]